MNWIHIKIYVYNEIKFYGPYFLYRIDMSLAFVLLQIQFTWRYEKVFYLIEAFSNGKRLWISNDLANVWAWIDNLKYQILTLQSQKVAEKKKKEIFSDNLICNIKLKLQGYLNLLQQVRCFITWWVEISIMISDNNFLQSNITEKI